jgi:hypothetical protein
MFRLQTPEPPVQHSVAALFLLAALSCKTRTGKQGSDITPTFPGHNSLARIGFSAAGVTDRGRAQVGAPQHAQTPRGADEHPEDDKQSRWSEQTVAQLQFKKKSV